MSARPLTKLSPTMDYEWRLQRQVPFWPHFADCWASGCTQLAVWDLTHYRCASSHCGKHPDHPRHRVGHEHYCHQHAIERGLEPIDDPRIRRVREHPWKLDEEVAA